MRGMALAGLALLMTATPMARAAAPAQWTDATTGHRIVRVDDRPGNYALYFNYNPFTPDGRRMVYLTPEGIRVADTRDWSTTLLLKEKVDRLLFVGNRAPVAYYTTNPTGGTENEGPSVIWSVDLDTGKRRRIAELPGGRIESISADDRLLAGHVELEPPPPAIAAQGRRDPKTGSPSYSGTGPDGRPLSFAQAKAQWMAARLAAGVPMESFHHRHPDRRAAQRHPVQGLAQPCAIFAQGPDAADVLPRGALGEGGSHLDHPHRWQRQDQSASTPVPGRNRGPRILGARWPHHLVRPHSAAGGALAGRP